MKKMWYEVEKERSSLGKALFQHTPKLKRKELKIILEQHKVWLASNQTRGKQANFHRANLRSVNLKRANLKCAILSEAYLEGANLCEANLENADLSNADIRYAELNDASLIGADIHHSRLRATKLNKANLNDANLSGSNLSGVEFNDATLRGADLTGANLNGTELNHADLTNANLSFADVEHTEFDEANLSGANFSGVDLKGHFLSKNAILKYVTIDLKSKLYISDNLLQKYGHTFSVNGIATNPSIIRSIEFPLEYCEAGKTILSYFGTVLKQKYPNKKTSVTIKQEDLKVTMTIETEEGDKEEIEKFLDQYGLVVLGDMPPEFLFEDPLDVMELKQKLKMAQFELQQKQEFIDFQKSQIQEKSQELKEARLEMKEFRALIGQSLQTTQAVSTNHVKAVESLTQPDPATQALIAIIQTFIEKQSADLKQPLQTIARAIQNPNPTQQEQDAVAQSIETIHEKDPTVFQELADGLSNFTMGVGSSVWATVIVDVLKVLGG